MSSPQIMRILGLSVLGISLSHCMRPRRDGVSETSNHHSICNRDSTLFERSDVKRHTQDRRDSDDEKNERSNQRQRHRKDALAMDEPFRPHRLPQMAQSQHELHMIDDAQDKHHDAEPNQSEAEITRRSGLG